MEPKKKKKLSSKVPAVVENAKPAAGSCRPSSSMPPSGLALKRLRKKAGFVQERLAERYPHPETHLNARDPWELTIATILAAQCTDERVNTVTPELFARWPGPAAMARAQVEDVEQVVRPTGFYHNKAKNIVASAQIIMASHGGRVPATMKGLLTLPGVARKTANVVLWGAFGRNEGIAVDTHVARIAFRLGLTGNTDPVRIEKDLVLLFPREEWGNVNHRLVWFGRHVCDARKPLCSVCEMTSVCEKNGVTKSG